MTGVSWGAGFINYWPASLADSGNKTALQVDSAFVFETSGDAIVCRFISPVSQTSGTLTINAFVTADSGTTSSFNVQVRNANTSGDQHRPESGGSTIGTPGSAVDLNGTAASWATFTVTGLTLTAGLVYFIIIENLSASPASDHATIVYRPGLDGQLSNILGEGHKAGTTVNGITSDPVMSAALSPVVVSFDDGTIIGNPYVDTGVNASGTDYRGNQWEFPFDVEVIGLCWATTSTALSGGTAGLYETDGTILIEKTISFSQALEVTMQYFGESITIAANSAFNSLIKPALSTGSITMYDLGETSPPADVVSAGLCNGSVKGSDKAALTLNTAEAGQIWLILGTFAAPGGGGSASVLGQIGLNGGLQ